MLDQAGIAILLNGAFNPAEIFFIHKEHKSTHFRVTKNLYSTALIKHFEVARA
jgi:hypothetical protein